jgi:hypothetical protein
MLVYNRKQSLVKVCNKEKGFTTGIHFKSPYIGLCNFSGLGNLILHLPDSTEKHSLEDQPNWVLTVGLSLASNVILQTLN